MKIFKVFPRVRNIDRFKYLEKTFLFFLLILYKKNE